MRLNGSASFRSASKLRWLVPAPQAAIVAVAGCLLPAVLGSAGHGGTKEREVDAWAQALRLGSNHSPAARAALADLAETAEEGPVRRLAEVILEEWSLPCEDRKLRSPRQVWAPEIKIQGEEVKSPMVVIVGEVLPNGSFLPREFKVRSGNKRVDAQCRAASRASRFRPALSCKGYVSGPAVISFHLYL